MLERSLCSIVGPGELFQSLHIQTRSMSGVGTKHVFQGSVGDFLYPCSHMLMTQKKKGPSIHMHLMYVEPYFE